MREDEERRMLRVYSQNIERLWNGSEEEGGGLCRSMLPGPLPLCPAAAGHKP